MSRSYSALVSSCDKVDVRFTTQYDDSNVNNVIAVTGSYNSLGSWDPKHALLLEKRGNKGCWSSVVKLPLSQYFEWKLIVIDKLTQTIQKWEEYPNRWNWIDRGPLEIIVAWNCKELERCSSCRCLIGVCRCTTIYTKLAPSECLVDVTFKVIYSVDTDDETIALIGSSKFLGDWDPAVSRLFPDHQNPVLTIQLPMNTCFEWKLALLNRRHRSVIRWEEGENRALRLQTCPLEVGVAWSQAAEIGYKCCWLDSHWKVSPCPCGRRYCCTRDTSCGSQTQDQYDNTSETTSQAQSCSPAIGCVSYIDDKDKSELKHEKSVHFPEDPVSGVIEREKLSETDDSLEELYVEIDGLGLDEMSYNNCSKLHRQTQEHAVSKKQINGGKLSPAKNVNQTRKHKNRRPEQAAKISDLLPQVNLCKLEKQVKDRDSPQLKLRSEHNAQIRDQLRPDKRTDNSDLDQPKELRRLQESNCNNFLHLEKGYRSDHAIEEKLGPKRMTNDSVLQAQDKYCSKEQTIYDEILSKKQQAKKQESDNDSSIAKHPKQQIGNDVLSLQAQQSREQVKSRAEQTTELVKLGDVSKQTKQSKILSKSSNFSEQVNASKRLQRNELSQPKKAATGDFSEIINQSDVSEQIQTLSESVSIPLQTKKPDKLVSCGELSLPPKQPEKNPEIIDLSLPTKPLEKLATCRNLPLSRHEPHKQTSCFSHTLLKKQPQKQLKNSNLSTSHHPKPLHESGNLTVHGKLPEKLLNYDNLSWPENRSEKLGEEPQALHKSGNVSLFPKKPKTIIGSVSLSMQEKQPGSLVSGFDSSVPAKQPERSFGGEDFLLQQKQTKKLSYLTLPSRKSESQSEHCDLSWSANLPDKPITRDNLSLQAKQSGDFSETSNSLVQANELSKNDGLFLQGSHKKKPFSCNSLFMSQRKSDWLSESADLSLSVKHPENPVSFGDLFELGDQRLNLNDQDPANFDGQKKSVISSRLMKASSALAVIVAGSCILNRYLR